MKDASTSAALDSWGELFSRFERGRTRTGAGYLRRIPNEETLRLIYGLGGFFANVIDIPVDEMTRKPPSISDDPDGLIWDYMQRRGMLEARQDSLRWASLFGGSVAVMLANDQTSQIWRPLREDRIVSVEGLRVYNRFRVSWSPADLYQDKTNPKYGQVEMYTINPLTLGGGTSFRIHETRCLVIDGAPCPEVTRIENLGWGDSDLIRGIEALWRMEKAFKDSSKVFDGFITRVIGIPNLMRMLMEGNAAKVHERIQLLKETRDLTDYALLDSGAGGDAAKETFEKAISSATGLPDLVDRIQGELAGTYRMPQTLLFGRSPAGMNATGESDADNWANVVQTKQENKLLPYDQRLVDVIRKAKDGPKPKGSAAQDPRGTLISYPSIKQVGPAAQAKIDSENMKTATQAITAGIVHPDEVRATLKRNPLFVLDPKYDDPTTRPRTMPKDPTDKDPDDEEGEEGAPSGTGGEPPVGGKSKKKATA